MESLEWKAWESLKAWKPKSLIKIKSLDTHLKPGSLDKAWTPIYLGKAGESWGKPGAKACESLDTHLFGESWGKLGKVWGESLDTHLFV